MGDSKYINYLTLEHSLREEIDIVCLVGKCILVLVQPVSKKNNNFTCGPKTGTI